MTARSERTATRTAGLLLAVVAVAIAAAFVGVAAGANVTTADRTIDQTELEPGESTTVTLEVTLDGTDDPAVYEAFDPAFERVEISSTEPEIDAVNDGNDELAAIWEETDAATLEYEVTVPDDAANGDTFAITGEAEAADGTMEITGDTQITVATDEFDVSITESNESVERGQSLETTAAIENTGDREGTQDVEFLFNGTVVDEENVTLAGGNDTTVTFAHDTGDVEPGEYDIEVRSDDDTDERNVTIIEPESDDSDGSDGSGDSGSGSPSSPSSPDDAFFDVTIADAAESVKKGESLVVNATVVNTGDETGTQDVEFLFDGVVKTAAEDVTIDGGEATSLTFALEMAVEPGEYDIEVRSDDDSATTTVAVVEPKGDGDGDETETESGTDEKNDGEGDAETSDDEADDDATGADETTADDESAADEGASDRADDSGGESDDSTPGFGPSAVVVAIAAALLVGRRRSGGR